MTFNRVAFKEAGKKVAYKNYWPTVAVSFLLAIAYGAGITLNFAGKFEENGFGSNFRYQFGYAYQIPVVGFILGLIATFFAAFAVFSIAVRILAANPYQVGAGRFFMENRYKDVGFSTVGVGFSKNFGNVIITQLLKDLYTILWSLLFVVPGIVRAYGYFCVPYILAENPDLDYNRVLSLSREMTMGYKGELFVTDLSFILWEILNSLTLGILGVFYLNPYMFATKAEIYSFLRQNALEKGISNTTELKGFSEWQETT